MCRKSSSIGTTAQHANTERQHRTPAKNASKDLRFGIELLDAIPQGAQALFFALACGLHGSRLLFHSKFPVG